MIEAIFIWHVTGEEIIPSGMRAVPAHVTPKMMSLLFPG
jgi:hypothetical protein